MMYYISDQNSEINEYDDEELALWQEINKPYRVIRIEENNGPESNCSALRTT